MQSSWLLSCLAASTLLSAAHDQASRSYVKYMDIGSHYGRDRRCVKKNKKKGQVTPRSPQDVERLLGSLCRSAPACQITLTTFTTSTTSPLPSTNNDPGNERDRVLATRTSRAMEATQNKPAVILQPIKDSRLRHWMILLALQTTGRFYASQGNEGTCIPISRHKIVKIQRQEEGELTHLIEATTMQYVATHTSMPVPKVHCTFERNGQGYIVMDRIRGQTLHATLDSLHAASRKSIFDQLRAAFDELRSLEPPSLAVQSCVGGSLSDSRIVHSDDKRFGPFESIAAFHLWLRQYRQLPLSNPLWSDEEAAAVEKMIRCQDSGSWPPPVLTHADLHASNILVHNDKVTGIVDWDSAGWYPNYWEYTSAWCAANIKTEEWRHHLQCFLDTFPRELEMEMTRNEYFGQL